MIARGVMRDANRTLAVVARSMIISSLLLMTQDVPGSGAETVSHRAVLRQAC